VSGLIAAHYGRGFDYRNLAENWSSTANAIERMGYLAKDVVLPVDDLAPQKTESGRRMMEEKAERVMRTQGNQQARNRMNSDATLKDGYPPRGLMVASGEDVPTGESLRARLFIHRMAKGDVALATVVDIDVQHAKTGMLAEAMHGYIQYLAAPRRWFGGCVTATVHRVVEDEIESRRTSPHARQPGVADDRR
jgi:hypothetical protein